MSTFAKVLAATQADVLRVDPAVVLVGAGLISGGFGGTAAGLLAEFGVDRVIELPIADRGTVSMAVGLALGGRKVLVALDTPQQLLSVLDVLADAAALGAGEFSCPVVLRVACGGEAGRFDAPVAEALGAIAGLTVAVASSADVAAGLIRAGLAGRGPVVIFEPRSLHGERAESSGAAVALGVGRVVRPGDHVTLLSWGAGVAAAVTAAESLAAEGTSAEVIDLVTLSPADGGLIQESVRHTGRLVVVDPGDGIGARLVNLALAGAFEYLESPPVAVAPGSALAAARDALSF